MGPCPQPIGGQPIILSQGCPQAMPGQSYPYGQQRPMAQSARGQAPIKSPVVRGQIPDATSPLPTLAMPAPEAFGIRLGQKDDAPLDWNQLRQQLDKLGASSFQLDKQGSGFRFACQLPMGLIEGQGASEAEAVRFALAKSTK